MKDTTFVKVALVVLGIAVGVGFGGAVGYAYKTLAPTPGSSPAAGAHYDSLEDFRKDIVKRDVRDQKPGGNVSLRAIIQPHASDEIIYTLKPNLNVNFKSAAVQTNSHGVRGPEREFKKPAGVHRLAVLGDSFAFGWGVKNDESFSAELEKILNSREGKSKRVEVLNYGVPGYSTFQEVALFRDVVLEREPDSVLLYFVDNDFGMPFFIKPLDGEGKIELSNNFNKKRKAVKGNPGAQKKINALLARLDPNAELAKLAELCAAKGIALYVTVNPRRGWKHDLKRLHVLGSRKDLRYIPLREKFVGLVDERNIDRKKLILSKQDPHPTAIMHRLLAEILAEGISTP